MMDLHKKVESDENYHADYEARARNSKQPCSLSLEQEDRARARFYANQLREPNSAARREIIDLVNIDAKTGRVNHGIYNRLKKLIDTQN